MIRFRVFCSLALSLAAVMAGACADYDAPTALSAPSVASMAKQNDNGKAVGLKADSTTSTSGGGSMYDTTATSTSSDTASMTTIDGETWITVNSGSNAGNLRVRGIKWASTRPEVEYTASAIIGPAGGSIAVPGADFELYFTKDAVKTPTTITVVAQASGWVQYDFKPHGLTFNAPVYAIQGLRQTAIYGTATSYSVFGAYLPTGEQIGSNGTATSSEELWSAISLQESTGVPELSCWLLKHFSRYILASG
jgi:hypothetical protein